MIQKRELLNRIKRVKSSLNDEHIYQSIVDIENIYAELEETPYKNTFERIKDTFNFMIDYFSKDTPDTQRENIYNSMRKDLYDITDYIQEYLLAYQSTNYQNIYSFYHQRVDLIGLIENFKTNKEEIDNLFSRIWLSDKFDAATKHKINELLLDKQTKNKIKSILVSAITMSLIRVFDVEKFDILFDAYYNLNEETSMRALVGIVLAMYIYPKRALHYPDLIEKFSKFNNSEDDLKNLEMVILQLIKTKETENIIKEFNEDILPEMMKMKNDLPQTFSNEINLDDLSSENSMDDENPGWENYIDKNPEFFERMEKFTMRQFSGSDIFSATLGNLKNFSFFKKISNWFIPFTSDNPEVISVLKQNLDDELTDNFLEVFEKAFYFCNSDKFSFCLHIPDIAEPMRKTAIQMIISEIQSAQEIMGDNMADKSKKIGQDIIVRYIQDLYRFYNFNNNFTGFKNIFKLDTGIHKTNIFTHLSNFNNIIRNSAELLFSQKMFYYAAQTFEKAIENGVNEPEVYEKTAFSFQKTNNYSKALDYYKKAEFFDQNKKWLYKKIGFTYLKIKDFKNALDYYLKAEAEDSDDIATQSFIGRCYTELGNFNEALKYFFKADFFKPDNIKTMRSIEYCSYKTGKFDQAVKYAFKCVEIEPYKFDFFIIGNVLWIQNKKTEAIQYYITAMSEFDNFNEFKIEFSEFKKFLLEHNISEFDYNLMLDYLEMKFYF